jgi:hypothetical protein
MFFLRERQIVPITYQNYGVDGINKVKYVFLFVMAKKVSSLLTKKYTKRRLTGKEYYFLLIKIGMIC